MYLNVVGTPALTERETSQLWKRKKKKIEATTEKRKKLEAVVWGSSCPAHTVGLGYDCQVRASVKE